MSVIGGRVKKKRPYPRRIQPKRASRIKGAWALSAYTRYKKRWKTWKIGSYLMVKVAPSYHSASDRKHHKNRRKTVSTRRI